MDELTSRLGSKRKKVNKHEEGNINWCRQKKVCKIELSLSDLKKKAYPIEIQEIEEKLGKEKFEEIVLKFV